jgi:uncharacterized tellurite resistance protein B-like protein
MNFNDTPLDLPQIQAIVRAMHEVALADGLHDAERVMLRGFYDACQEDAGALTSFDELIATPFDAAAARELFGAAAQRAALLQSCILLAYADGKYSDGERAKVRSLAQAAGATDAEIAAVEGSVGDTLIQQISRISNVDALKQVSSELETR